MWKLYNMLNKYAEWVKFYSQNRQSFTDISGIGSICYSTLTSLWPFLFILIGSFPRRSVSDIVIKCKQPGKPSHTLAQGALGMRLYTCATRHFQNKDALQNLNLKINNICTQEYFINLTRPLESCENFKGKRYLTFYLKEYYMRFFHLHTWTDYCLK